MASTLARVIVGSQAYGTAVPGSDTDYLTILEPSKSILLGLERADRVGGDEQAYYIHDYVHLLLKGGINVLEPLFMEPEETSEWWEELRSISGAFVCKRIGRSVYGYVNSEMNRIERQRRWMLGGPFPEEEGSYRKFKPSRELMEFGWDTKAGYHILRLIRQMAMLEQYCKLRFPLDCAEELIAVRNGQMTYAYFMDMIEGEQFWWDLADEPILEPIEEYLRCYFMHVLS